MFETSLPREVLNLFPMFEFRCPLCKTYVAEAQPCPKCGAPFVRSLWKVPPRFLRSRRAMSRYAHQVLAPQLKPSLRSLLFKYFTVFFENGFEEGDFSAWTGTNNGANANAPVVQGAVVHCGSHAALFTVNVNSWTGYTYCYRVLPSEYATLFVRAYIYFDDLADGSPRMATAIGLRRNGTNKALQFGLQNFAGTQYWHVSYHTGAGWRDLWRSATPVPTADQWYCLELMGVISLTLGEQRAWVDGVEVIAQTGLDMGTALFDRIDVGRFLSSQQGSAGDSYADCVIASDLLSGPETILTTVLQNTPHSGL